MIPEDMRPPCHYVLAEEIGLKDGHVDAQIVVACDHDVQSYHWFTKEPKTVTCPGCRESFWRPRARAYRFLDGEPVET